MALPLWLVFVALVSFLSVGWACVLLGWQAAGLRGRVALLERSLELVGASEREWKTRAEILMDQHLVRSGVSPVLHPPASPAGEGAVGLTMRAFGVREIDSSKRKQAG